MQSEKQYRQNNSCRDEMKKFLESFAGQEFLHILEDKAKPRGTPQPRQGQHPDTATSQHYYKINGLQDAADLVRRLATDYTDKTDDENETESAEFFHALPPEMKSAIRQQLQDRKKQQA